MIQRIQSVYFVLAAVLLFVYAFFCDFNIMNFAENVFQSFIPAIMSLVIGFLALVAVFLFKKRNFQTLISSLLIGLVITTIAFFIYNFGVKLFYKEWTFYLLPIGLIFLFLGRKNVIKDEKLIKSIDRLR